MSVWCPQGATMTVGAGGATYENPLNQAPKSEAL
jgi:hypothetical protein